MLTPDLQKFLLDLTKENDPDKAVRKLIENHINFSLNHCRLLNKLYEEKKGMSFKEYEDTKSDEWDGDDWNKIEEFHDWEDAISEIEYYTNLLNKWKSLNFSQV